MLTEELKEILLSLKFNILLMIFYQIFGLVWR